MKLLYVLAATAIILSPHHANAQAFTPAEIRDQLGGPVDIEAAALFAATRASYKDLCGADPEAEFHAAIINRLQYGALDDVDKPAFQQLMAGQVTSNAKIFTGLDLHARASFCDGLNGAVLHSAAEFVRAHPALFEATQPPIEPAEQPGLIEQIEAHVAALDPLVQIYVIKTAENRVFEDFKSIAENPENNTPQGQTWLFKVISGQMALLSVAAKAPFPEIAALYEERSDIYARLVRGEITVDDLSTLEPTNERTKRMAFEARFAQLQAADPDANPDMTAVNAAIDELSSMVIGGGKMLASSD